ncbi:class I adenylate cyclase [Shewanella litorisediminis]|uniref:Class I adenylate cyclase n=1 Tax=Shewanella litorisediminis TaxID=1173586 RepID=A0ABX7G2A8_9GAMM|nr:class I adenylate cyclase [Shewanella litorisediminis]MCL2918643.1 class I adenylate cyclase [Shewanella litorisediminis]QRH01466.1 class I adenylate cyclase [Shewanella litorisediminis]
MIAHSRWSTSALSLSERLNKVRLARALALLSPLKRHLLHAIPLLLHFHGPRIPGYNGHATPCGLASFEPQEPHLEAASVLSLGLPSLRADWPYAIEGIYAMGSTGSFGQNPFSDVDVWVIHEPNLSADDILALADKLALLHQWFAGFEFEVNFYLVHPFQFRADKSYSGNGQVRLGVEHSGSAQHWLLLEEFYRTQICLGGKPLYWWPDARSTSEGLWLGDVQSLPASEYFSASLWQLYKGLVKPHKALLKVLLLEAYAWRYPNTEQLSARVWLHTTKGDFSTANDPYFLLYEAIEEYLLAIEDHRRLEIVRRCFYLKCAVRLSHPQQPKDWRYLKMQLLVSAWEWPDTLIQTLDDCEEWHTGQLQWFNAQLNELMLASYQTLLRFAANHGVNEGLRVEDLGMLTRKLHTCFNEDKHLVSKLNPLWSSRLQEPVLTVITSQSDRTHYLYRQEPQASALKGEAAVYVADNLASLLLWSCINQVCDDQTQWYCYGERKLGARLAATGKRLREAIRDTELKVSKQDLCQPWHYRKLVLLVNLEHDPTPDWPGQEVLVDIMNANLFSLGRTQRNMLGSLDVLSFNSWGEWHAHHFEGEQALLKAMTFLAPGIRRAAGKLDLRTLGCSTRLTFQLELAVHSLLKQVATLSCQANASSTLVQPLRIGTRSYGLFFNTLGVAYEDLADAPSIYKQMSRGHLLSIPRPGLGDDPFASVPELIQDYATEDVIQYFLRPREAGIDVFILNHKNEISHYVQHGTTVEALVSKVSQQHAFEGLYEMHGRFNLPQFFQLVRMQGELKAQPVGMAREDMGAEF